MADQTQFERSLDRWVAKATTPRGAAVVIATVSTTMTLVAGTLMTVIDREQFPSIGSGLWWAAQTVTTVGYGDNVPVSFAGRLLAVALMLLGIGFLTVITAAITSTFVARSSLEVTPGTEPAAAEKLSEIEQRLARIEAALTRSSTAS